MVRGVLKKDDVASGCAPPGSGPKRRSKGGASRACTICGKKMYFAEDFQVYVCLNKEHGVLAYYGLDDCYFTSQEVVAARFAKEGKKFHMIEPEVLQMIGVES